LKRGKLTFLRNKITLLLTLAIVLSVGLVFALSQEVRLKKSTPTISTAEGVNEQLGLKLTLTLERTEYNLGEPVNMTLTLSNIENQSVSFNYFYDWWDFRIYNVTSFGQNDLYWGNGGHDEIPHGGEVSLDPEMSTSAGFSWRQVCNSTVDRYGQPISPVLPGTYYLVGMYDDFRRNFDYNLQTAPIQITIVQL